MATITPTHRQREGTRLVSAARWDGKNAKVYLIMVRMAYKYATGYLVQAGDWCIMGVDGAVEFGSSTIFELRYEKL